ncbi:MAG: N-acetyltransferase, partial [Gammaproteobacteria bacterium]|nr:N-acetyltransferase [Gammaproteobacteria bacterium]
TNPFVRHEFLAALEHSGCVTAKTGWRPQHLSCTDEYGKLTGALPLYLKSHSYGEYVFDWTWAEAWQRAGLVYYPKLVSAVPFSPVSGPRLLLAQTAAKGNTAAALINKTHDLAKTHQASSIHCLFPSTDEIGYWESQHYMLRKDCQFHWHNRDYRSFDDYLAALSAEYRKKIKRERRRITQAGITHRTYNGDDLDERLLEVLHRFYVATYAKRARPAYLNPAFFAKVAACMPDALLVIIAFMADEPVACAIFFRNADTLFGRHWGCEREFHSLHFETCYYQGIEYCIRAGLQHFNPGTQGEHKLARGFEPTATCSLHWVAEPSFRKPIADFLQQETRMVDAYLRDAAQHLPFRAER